MAALSGSDTQHGGAGNDTLFGGRGDDGLFGEGGNDRLFGGRGDDALVGGAGNDRLHAQAGADLLDGGAGDDVLIGGGHADTFVFSDGHGHDRILDFDLASAADRVDLSGVSAIADFAALLASTTQTAAGALIETGENASILLENVEKSDLEASDFVF